MPCRHRNATGHWLTSLSAPTAARSSRSHCPRLQSCRSPSPSPSALPGSPVGVLHGLPPRSPLRYCSPFTSSATLTAASPTAPRFRPRQHYRRLKSRPRALQPLDPPQRRARPLHAHQLRIHPIRIHPIQNLQTLRPLIPSRISRWKAAQPPLPWPVSHRPLCYPCNHRPPAVLGWRWAPETAPAWPPAQPPWRLLHTRPLWPRSLQPSRHYSFAAAPHQRLRLQWHLAL
jgi:hypothetical protein